MNNEENLYNEFDVLSANRNISWNDFLMMPVKVKRYIIGRVQQQYETMQESIDKKKNIDIILKISGLWEDDSSYGITYKFLVTD